MSKSAAFDGKRMRKAWRWLAWIWLLLVVAVGWHQWQFWHAQRIDSDILALLPQDAQDPLLSQATRSIADASARHLVVLLGASTAEQAKQAAQAFQQVLQGQSARAQGSPLRSVDAPAQWLASAQDFYAPHRGQLLTVEQRERLRDASPSELAEASMAGLFSPLAAPRLTEWRDDPLGLWPQWWQQRAEASGMQLGEDGLLQAEDRYWAVLHFETVGSAFHLDGQRHLQDLLDMAKQGARARVADLEILNAGVPLHAEAAAVQANREINTIGWGSLTAVILLVWLAFGSLRPILLVAMSLLLGCAVALSVTAMVFGQVHLLTLIFGASLVGVAEDYGIHWFASRQGVAARQRWLLLRSLLPGLCLALVTSSVAYLALGLPPFPGLRQMALFSIVGLGAAFLTVVCWFPWLDRGEYTPTRFSLALGRSLSRWPQLRWNRASAVLAIVLLALLLPGWARLQVNDDLRSLQSSPSELIKQQAAVGRLLGMPSPAQFYLVRGDTAEQVLQREEALTTQLRALTAQGVIGGYRAVSDWLPSRRQQMADAALSARVETCVLQQVGHALGEKLAEPATVAPIHLTAWLQSPVSAPFRPLWLGKLGEGQASVVMINDMGSPNALEQLAARADDLAGVRWVNRIDDFSRLLAGYRQQMSWLMGVGVLLVIAVMVWRYRRHAWRAVLPTLLAMLVTTSLLGWMGQPLQLFNVLALTLLLGMGIDYGIFLLEHRGESSAWVAVCVGAASTWLSFGLLALSSTPALRAFGLTLLLGIGLVWLISPLFRRGSALPTSSSAD